MCSPQKYIYLLTYWYFNINSEMFGFYLRINYFKDKKLNNKMSAFSKN